MDETGVYVNSRRQNILDSNMNKTWVWCVAGAELGMGSSVLFCLCPFPFCCEGDALNLRELKGRKTAWKEDVFQENHDQGAQKPTAFLLFFLSKP